MPARTTPSRGEKRREEILKTALSLFNEQGTAAVSTNHIAAELGISVGNLYWHFGDKEAIVRALFQELRESFDTAWRAPVTESDALNAAIIGLRRAFTTAWEYRFFYRELVALTQRDPELKRLNVANRAERRHEIRQFLKTLVHLGILAIPDEDTLDRLEELGWMVSSFWVPHVDLRDGALTKRAVLAGTSALLSLYLPFATKEHAVALSRALATEREDP